MGFIDLHMHSNYSDDGELDVLHIIDICRNQNMEMVAITDHNSIKANEQAIILGRQKDIKVLSGVELDCVYKNMNFHLLGYGFDYRRKEFLEIEEDIYRQEIESASIKIAKFKKATGFPITENEVFDKAKGNIVTGEMIGEIVLNKEEATKYGFLKPYLKNGDKSDMPYVNFYWDFFSQGKVAYVPIQYISLNDARNLIKSANGICILAHPMKNLKDKFGFINKIIEEGIDGIEAFSSYHSEEAVQYFYNIARENQLLATCGSDFHGKNKPNIKIGDCKLSIDENIIVDSINNLFDDLTSSKCFHNFHQISFEIDKGI